jgi:phage gp29-like protein
LLHTTTQRVVAVLRALGSLLPNRAGRRDASRLIRSWREDSLRSYPTTGLTPSRLRAFLQSADGGSPQMQFELFEEMLQKWPRPAAVENTRRLALTGLDWEIVAASEPADSTGEAERAADSCRETLARVERFRETLDHFAQAIGCGIAVAELVWEGGRLVDVVPVPSGRLIADPHEPWRLRVLTEEEPALGIALDEYPAKWIVHQPRAALGRNFDGGLLRASALLYLAQTLSFKDWLIYSQIAGMPVRVAQFEPGTPEADKQQLLKMLEALGTDAVAVLGKNVDLKFVEPARGGPRPYEPLQDYCNTEITILWLGQHLTTDVRGTGSRAAAEIHDRVREDLLVSDIAAEGRTIRRDLLTPLVQSRFGDGVAVPQFRRALVQAVDTKSLADTLAVAVNELGLAVPRQWVHQALGIPAARGDEPVLEKGSNA